MFGLHFSGLDPSDGPVFTLGTGWNVTASEYFQVNKWLQSINHKTPFRRSIVESILRICPILFTTKTEMSSFWDVRVTLP